jgi:hypothetical protein
MHRQILPFALWLACLGVLAVISLGGLARGDDSSSGKGESAKRAAGEKLFREQIRPILTAHCKKCHNAEKTHGLLNLDLQDFAPGLTESGEMVAEVPLGENELWRRVTSDDPMERMPLELPPLSATELEAIRQWAEAGAPWPVNRVTPPAVAQQDNSLPWWVRVLAPLETVSRYFEPFSAYRPAAYLALGLLCIAAVSEVLKRRARQRGEFAKSWQRLLCRMVNGTFYVACLGAFVACVAWLRIEELTQKSDKLEIALSSTREELAHERQVIPTTSTGEPAAYYFPRPKQLGGIYYRGNDERNEALFNGGRYRTCTFTVSLCDAQRKPLAVGGAVPPGLLFVRLEIERAPFAAKSLFSRKVIAAAFASPLKQHEKITDRAKQIIPFETVVNGDRWAAYIPFADVRSAGETMKLAGTIYLYNGGKREIENAPSYTVRYDVQLDGGKLTPDCDLCMGVIFIPSNFAVPPPDKDSITDWFDIRPIPEIVGGNTTDPTLLGVKPHEERLGTPLKADDDEKK